MKNLKNKSKISTITLILTLTLSAILVGLPTVNAAEIPTFCYISVASPNPIGVNQEIVLVFWINAIPPTALGAAGDRWIFNVEINTPTGSTETIGPFSSDPVGGGWGIYTPTEVGTYTLTAVFLDYTITGLPLQPDGSIQNPNSVGNIYLESTSDPYILEVQSDPVEPWPITPVTEEY